MGYSTSGGPNGLGTFNNTPSTTADLNQLVTLIALVGNGQVGTSTERATLTGAQLYNGLLWSETDTGHLMLYNGSAWVSVYGGDSGWVNITLASGYSSQSITPQVRLIGSVLYFIGDVKPNTGSFAASSAITIVNPGGIPSGFRPVNTNQRQIPGNSQNLDVRAYIGTDGSLNIVTGASVPAYVDISAFSGATIN